MLKGEALRDGTARRGRAGELEETIRKKDWERTEREMISNQVIQNSIDELRAITKVDLGIYDVEGMKVAATTEDIDISYLRVVAEFTAVSLFKS